MATTDGSSQNPSKSTPIIYCFGAKEVRTTHEKTPINVQATKATPGYKPGTTWISMALPKLKGQDQID